MWFRKKKKEQDWSKWLGKVQLTKKQRLIEFCEKKGISIYLDDSSETSAGVYANFRGVVSETELEKRVNDYKKFYWQKVGTIFAIICSVAAGVVWLGGKLKFF